MGFRIGTKIGKKTFVSLGKSGTYISTWIGGFRISKFTPSKRTKAKPKEKIGRLVERSRRRSNRSVVEQPYDNPYLNNPYYVSESDKLELKRDTAFNYQLVLTIICSGALLGLVYLMGLFYIPLGIALSINLIGTHLIWRKVDGEDKWVWYALPLVSLFSVAGIITWSLLLIASWILIII